MKKIGEFELNKIYCMDCLEGLKKLPDNSIDLVVTDPPYNTGMVEKKVDKRKTKKPRLFSFFNDSYTNEDYLKLIETCCNNFYRILKENSTGYIYMNWKKLGLWLEFLEKAGFSVKNVIVWDKVIHGLNYQNYAYTYELIIYFVKGKPILKNKSIEDKRKGYFKDVWNIQRKISNETNEFHHETQKLLKIVKIPIIHSSNEKDIVLDPFMGSGTTAVACKQLGRNFIGFEISKKYCEMANKRLAQQTLDEFKQENEKRRI